MTVTFENGCEFTLYKWCFELGFKVHQVALSYSIHILCTFLVFSIMYFVAK